MSTTRPGLTDGEIRRLVNRWIGVTGGYLGDFTYRTHEDFYIEYCNLDDINPYQIDGTTRERFIEILTGQHPARQAAILRGVLARFPLAARNAPKTRTPTFAEEIAGWAHRLEGETVVDPHLAYSSDVVKRALADAEVLLRESGPTSATDRMHTALHGHLMYLCRQAGITFPDDATNVALLKRLRSAHPDLQDLGSRAHDVEKILNAFGSVLDALNPIRNRGSVAHPNNNLLGEAEAMLAINAARTVLGYLDERLTPPPTSG